jgi:tRNA (guanosine-2'-O-)-methyltransferase
VHQFDDAEKCFETLRARYTKVLTTHLSSDATGLYDVNMLEPIALVFGNEQTGVSEEIRAMADGNFIIPQVGIIRSLNISVACAVTLYEAFRQKNNAGHYNRQDLDHVMKKGLLQEWSLHEES